MRKFAKIETLSIIIVYLGNYYVMGFEENLGVFTKSLPDHGLGLNGQDNKGNLVIKQTLDDVFQNLYLIPNTKSFGLEERLSYSFLHESRKATGLETSYRNNGILFTHRDDQQDFFMPSDMLALSTCNIISDTKEEVLKNIQTYYNHNIIDQWRLLGSDTVKTSMHRLHHLRMLLGRNDIPDNELLLFYINDFRDSQGYQPLTKDHMRMLSYNECIKFTPLKINILGVYGSHHNIVNKSNEYNIPHYKTLKDYLDTIK